MLWCSMMIMMMTSTTTFPYKKLYTLSKKEATLIFDIASSSPGPYGGSLQCSSMLLSESLAGFQGTALRKGRGGEGRTGKKREWLMREEEKGGEIRPQQVFRGGGFNMRFLPPLRRYEYTSSFGGYIAIFCCRSSLKYVSSKWQWLISRGLQLEANTCIIPRPPFALKVCMLFYPQNATNLRKSWNSNQLFSLLSPMHSHHLLVTCLRVTNPGLMPSSVKLSNAACVTHSSTLTTW